MSTAEQSRVQLRSCLPFEHTRLCLPLLGSRDGGGMREIWGRYPASRLEVVCVDAVSLEGGGDGKGADAGHHVANHLASQPLG